MWVIEIDNEEIFKDLISGTDFKVSTMSQVLTSCELKVRTPIEALNGLLGGGLPLNGIYHTYGEPKGGKSTWLYQTMGNFQQQYPDGISVIIDTERSADANRLRALGVNSDKVLVLPAPSIEGGFLALFKVLDNKKKNKKLEDLPIFIIWDTISRGLAQDDSTQSRMNAMDRARIIKNYLPDLSSRIENQPFFLGLINQVVRSTDRYGNIHEDAGGGVALKHDNHLSLYISYKEEDTDDAGFLLTQVSSIDIDKSKISPRIKGLPMRIDATKGGLIDERESFLSYMIDGFHFYDKSGSYYKPTSLIEKYKGTPIGDYLDKNHNKNKYLKAIYKMIKGEDTLYTILQYAYLDTLSQKFTLQAEIIKPYFLEIEQKLKELLNVDSLIGSGEVKDEEVTE